MIARLAFAGLVLAATAAPPVCQVPVFRYALERWEPDAHEVLILSDGPLSEDHATLLEQLEPDPVSGSPVANLRSRVLDGSTADSRRFLDQWRATHPSAKLPQILVRSPDVKQEQPVIWSAPLSRANLDQMVDSSVRQELSEELIDGTTAVWVLLQSGNEKADMEAEETLRTRLRHNETAMKLSMPDAQDIADGFDPKKLKLRFKLLTVNRADKDEGFLVQSLLNVESDLADDEYTDQPMAFPVFGRGRALYALIGKGIANDVIDEACHFLIGPCSCQVKEQNPGVDLLMAVDWNALVETSINTDVELPPLMGLSGFGKSRTETEDEPAAGVVVERNDSQPPEPARSGEEPNNETRVPAPAVQVKADSAMWILFGVGAIGVLGILALTFMIMKQ